MNITLKVRRVQISKNLKIMFRFVGVLKILYWKNLVKFLSSDIFKMLCKLFRSLKEIYYFQINIAVDQLIGLEDKLWKCWGENHDEQGAFKKINSKCFLTNV